MPPKHERSKAAKIQPIGARADSPGSTGCRRRVGFGDLPEEVLLLIFSFLRGPLLRPLRLVCRAFRQASLERVTGMRLTDGSNESSVISALRAFPGIASLTIQARVPASVQTWPSSVSQLRSLTVHAEATCDGYLLTGLITHLHGLTSFKFLNRQCCIHYLCHWQDIVACCHALQSLELQLCMVSWIADDCARLLQLTVLQELKLPVKGPVWSSLLPRLTCLTLLHTLTCVGVESSEDVKALAALTQLTSLGGCMELPHWLDCLQALTGLKRISVGFPGGGWPNVVRGPLIRRRLPTSLEGLCLLHWCYEMSDEDLRDLSGMTRLDHLEIGYTVPSRIPSGDTGHGHWSLEGANPWCSRLVGLRHLGLVGQPTGAPSVRLLAQHLALEHLRLRLGLFDEVCHLSALTRLTLLHLYKEEEGQGMCARALGPPSFLMPLQQLRHLSLHWEVRVGEERETVSCMAALAELERLHVTLVPLERADVLHSLRSRAGGNASVKPATDSTQQQPAGATKELFVRQQRGRKRNLGIHVLEPLVRLGSLSELQVEGRYGVDKRTWETIQQLRGRLGLPALSRGFASTKTGDFCTYTAGLE